MLPITGSSSWCSYSWVSGNPSCTPNSRQPGYFAKVLTQSSSFVSLQQEHAKLAAANTILVIGGGIVGVELAGEVVTKLPGKRVVLLTSGPRLIADKPPDIGSRAKEFMERQGVEVGSQKISI